MTRLMTRRFIKRRFIDLGTQLHQFRTELEPAIATRTAHGVIIVMCVKVPHTILVIITTVGEHEVVGIEFHAIVPLGLEYGKSQIALSDVENLFQ